MIVSSLIKIFTIFMMHNLKKKNYEKKFPRKKNFDKKLFPENLDGKVQN